MKAGIHFEDGLLTGLVIGFIFGRWQQKRND